MEKTNVPLNQYPPTQTQTADLTGQPPVYSPDPNAQIQPQYQQGQPQVQYAASPPPPQQYAGSPPPQQYAGSPPPQEGVYGVPQQVPGQPQPQNPQQAYAAQGPQQSGTVYQNATPIASLGRGPAPADCPACGQRAMTNVTYEVGGTTHLWAAMFCFLACLGCIPYVITSLKDVAHKCGRCGVLLATWHRSGTTEVHIHS